VGQGGRPARGLGRGRGVGERPEKEDATRAYDTRSPAGINPRGVADISPTPLGPVVEGETRLEAAQLSDAPQGLPASAVDRERIPRRYKEHAREYLDALIGRTPTAEDAERSD